MLIYLRFSVGCNLRASVRRYRPHREARGTSQVHTRRTRGSRTRCYLLLDLLLLPVLVLLPLVLLVLHPLVLLVLHPLLLVLHPLVLLQQQWQLLLLRPVLLLLLLLCDDIDRSSSAVVSTGRVLW